jgi:hypothetical protein
VRRSCGLVLAERLEILARLETDGLAGRNGDLGAGARISSDAGFPGLDGEDAKASEFDTVATAQGLLHRFKDGVHGGFCLGPWKAGALNYPLD